MEITTFDRTIERLESINDEQQINEDRKISLNGQNLNNEILALLYLLRIDFIFLNSTRINSLKLIENYSKIELRSLIYTTHILYAELINHLNQYGRQIALLIKIYSSIQSANEWKLKINFYRIAFFRNIVVEHFEDYYSYRPEYFGYSRFGKLKKIPIPEHGTLSINLSKPKKKLLDVFKKSDVMLRLTKKLSYSEQIYLALEQIDPLLKSKDGDITRDLTNYLYKNGFPLPIEDIDIYLKNILKTLEKLFVLKKLK